MDKWSNIETIQCDNFVKTSRNMSLLGLKLGLWCANSGDIIHYCFHQDTIYMHMMKRFPFHDFYIKNIEVLNWPFLCVGPVYDS